MTKMWQRGVLSCNEYTILVGHIGSERLRGSRGTWGISAHSAQLFGAPTTALKSKFEGGGGRGDENDPRPLWSSS